MELGQKISIQNAVDKADRRAIGSFPWTAHPGFKDVAQYGTNVEDAISHSTLNWSAHKEPLALPDGRQVNAFAIVRDDNGHSGRTNSWRVKGLFDCPIEP